MSMNPFASCLEKQEKIKALFAGDTTTTEKYQRIIALGRGLAPLDPLYKTAENLVPGCQSVMFLRTYGKNDLLFFHAESEALISSGLAFLLTEVYSGETGEVVLKCPPTYLEELGIRSALSPGRANGLYAIHLKMKRDAVLFLTRPQRG